MPTNFHCLSVEIVLLEIDAVALMRHVWCFTLGIRNESRQPGLRFARGKVGAFETCKLASVFGCTCVDMDTTVSVMQVVPYTALLYHTIIIAQCTSTYQVL